MINKYRSLSLYNIYSKQKFTIKLDEKKMNFVIRSILKRSQLHYLSARFSTNNTISDDDELFKGLDGNHPCAVKRLDT